MKIKVNNCFHDISYYLVQYFLSEGFEVYGYDELDQTQKEFYYSMVGRNALFHFSDVTDNHVDEIDVTYTFNDDSTCLITSQKGKDNNVKIDYSQVSFKERASKVQQENTENQIEMIQFVKWLVQLNEYTLVPKNIVVFSQNREGIYII